MRISDHSEPEILHLHNVKLLNKTPRPFRQTQMYLSTSTAAECWGTSSVEGKDSFRLSYTGYTPRLPTAGASE